MTTLTASGDIGSTHTLLMTTSLKPLRPTHQWGSTYMAHRAPRVQPCPLLMVQVLLLVILPRTHMRLPNSRPVLDQEVCSKLARPTTLRRCSVPPTRRKATRRGGARLLGDADLSVSLQVINHPQHYDTFSLEQRTPFDDRNFLVRSQHYSSYATTTPDRHEDTPRGIHASFPPFPHASIHLPRSLGL